MGKFVYQIYYNSETELQLDPAFIPLDNTANERPDWFEFWVIRNFLKQNTLLDGNWYGFLSPGFAGRTGVTGTEVLGAIDEFDQRADVILFSSSWDQLAYFLNPFEQGEIWHPGLLSLSQSFCDAAGIAIDLKSLVTHSTNSVFSNYIIAKPEYWRRWLDLADRFWDLVEDSATAGGLARNTSYGSPVHLVPMKAFIQERLATIVLNQGAFRAVAPDQRAHGFVFERMFTNNQRTRRMLKTCDFLKFEYCRTGDDDYLRMFRKVRKEIDAKITTPA